MGKTTIREKMAAAALALALVSPFAAQQPASAFQDVHRDSVSESRSGQGHGNGGGGQRNSAPHVNNAPRGGGGQRNIQPRVRYEPPVYNNNPQRGYTPPQNNPQNYNNPRRYNNPRQIPPANFNNPSIRRRTEPRYVVPPQQGSDQQFNNSGRRITEPYRTRVQPQHSENTHRSGGHGNLRERVNIAPHVDRYWERDRRDREDRGWNRDWDDRWMGEEWNNIWIELIPFQVVSLTYQNINAERIDLGEQFGWDYFIITNAPEYGNCDLRVYRVHDGIGERVFLTDLYNPPNNTMLGQEIMAARLDSFDVQEQLGADLCPYGGGIPQYI